MKEGIMQQYSEAQRFLFLSEQCLNLTKKALNKYTLRYKLNHSQYLVLMILNYADHTGQKVNSTALSYLLGREKHTITTIVESLVKAGYVQRIANSSDRRIVELSLSEKGKSLISELQPLTYSTVAQIPLMEGPEKQDLFNFLETFRRDFAIKSGQDPELYSDAYNRLLVEGEKMLLKSSNGESYKEN